MYSSIDLFPASTLDADNSSDDILNYLKILKLFLEDIYISLYYLQTKKLYKFDAHVGETLCQIRAYKILSLQHKNLNTTLKITAELEKTLNTYYSKIKNVIEIFIKNKQSSKLYHSKITYCLRSVIKEYHLDFKIDMDILFVFLCYFLDCFKVEDKEGISIKVDLERVKAYLGSSKSFSKKLTAQFQKILSKLSCNFIFSILDETPNSENLKQVISIFYKEADGGKFSLPCYNVTEIILSHMISTQMNLLLVIYSNAVREGKPLSFCFKGAPEKNEFVYLAEANNKNIKKEGCLIITGISPKLHQLKTSSHQLKYLQEIGIKNIILMNAASHPQYSGKKLSAWHVNPFMHLNQCEENIKSLNFKSREIIREIGLELKNMQDKAIEKGCSSENKTTFFIKHIFCDTPEHQLVLS